MATFKDPKSLYNLHYLSSPHLSDDQQKLYYTYTTINSENDTYQSSIVERNLEKETETTLIDNGHINKSPQYSNNQLLYLSNKTGNFQVYLYNFNSQTSQQLTFSPQSIQFVQWVPTRNCFLFTTQLNESVNKEFKWGDITKQTNDSDQTYQRINNLKYQADGLGFIDTTAVNYLCEQTISTEDVSIISPQSTGYGLRRVCSISSDGDTIIYEKLLHPNDDYNSDTGLFMYNRQTNISQWVTSDFKTGIFGEAAISPDEKYIAFIGNPLPYETSNQFNLYLYEIEHNEIKLLTKNLDIQFGDNSVSDLPQNIQNPFIQWHPNSHKFYVQSSEFGQVLLNEISLSGDIETISPAQSVFKEFTISKDGTIFAVISYPDRPIELTTYKNKEWRVIHHPIVDHYENYTFSEYKEVQYKASDGGIIHGLMSLPPDFDPQEKYPLILNIHGGPYMMHSWNFYHEVQYMSANGYIVLLMNPRGSYGYGQEHTKGVYERYGKEDYSDLMTGIDKVIEDFSYIDEDNLFVTGGSYGGFMTNWIITQTNRFKAAVSQRSMSNFVSIFGTSDIGYFFYKDEMGYDIAQADKLWEASPIAYVAQVETPLLLIHPHNDLRCPFEQAQQFYVGLKHYQKTAEMLVFPNSSHELSRSGKPSYRVARIEAIVDWFNRYLES